MKTPDAQDLARRMLLQANARMDMAGMRVLYPATEDIAARIAALFTDQIPSLETPSEPALVSGFRAGRCIFYHQLDVWRQRHCTLPDVFRMYFMQVIGHVTRCAHAHDIRLGGSDSPWHLAQHGPLIEHYHHLALAPLRRTPEIRTEDIHRYADWVLSHSEKIALRYPTAETPRHG